MGRTRCPWCVAAGLHNSRWKGRAGQDCAAAAWASASASFCCIALLPARVAAELMAAARLLARRLSCCTACTAHVPLVYRSHWLTDEDIGEVMAQYDTNRDGVIRWEQAVLAWRYSQQRCMQG